MKKILFSPNVRADIRAVDQKNAMRILTALDRYAKTGHGDVQVLEGDQEGLLRLRAGDYRLLFDEHEDAIMVHRVRHRREAYR